MFFFQFQIEIFNTSDEIASLGTENSSIEVSVFEF